MTLSTQTNAAPMDERVVLPDCCEDYILAYGPFMPEGERFSCPECGTLWRKSGPTTFGWAESQKTFERHDRPVNQGIYSYLSAPDGHNPIVDRCCAKLLLHYGPIMQGTTIRCPICRTEWTRESIVRGGIAIQSFRSPTVAEPLAIQRSRARHFLVPLSDYSHPRD